MPTYEIRSVRGGVSDYSDVGISGAFKFASGIDIRKDSDTISCQQALVDETGVTFSGIIRFFVVASDGNTYGADNVGKIYKRDTNKDWSLVYTGADGAIKGFEEWPSDAGVSYLVWATDTKLNCKEIPGASDWSDVNTRADFPRTDLTSTDWHTMKPSGGDLIIANKHTLAALGYDSSYSTNVLDIIPGNVVKTLVERNGRTILGTHRSGYPNKGINAAIDGEVPLAQIGENGEIYFADMIDSLPAKRFTGGGKVNPGGVDIDIEPVYMFEWAQAASSNPDVNSFIDKKNISAMTFWGVYGADAGKNGLWTYGRINKNHPFVLNLDYPLEVDEIGAVKKSGDDILISYTDGESHGVKRIDTSTKATGIFEGLEWSPPRKKPVNTTNFSFVEIAMKPLPVGCSVEFYYKLDKTGDWVQATQADGTDEYNEVGGEMAVFYIAENAKVYEPRLVLNPYQNTTPEIYLPVVTHLE